MLPSDRFCINARQVVHERFDDEVLVINLETGTYYSFPGSSSRLWSLVVGGASVGEIVETYSGAHDHDPSEIAAAVNEFLARLCAEHLIVQDQNGTTSGPSSIVSINGAKTPFRPFEVNKFTDMQDLLLLDPIHDVEEAGWPLAKPDAAGPSRS